MARPDDSKHNPRSRRNQRKQRRERSPKRRSSDFDDDSHGQTLVSNRLTTVHDDKVFNDNSQSTKVRSTLATPYERDSKSRSDSQLGRTVNDAFKTSSESRSRRRTQAPQRLRSQSRRSGNHQSGPRSQSRGRHEPHSSSTSDNRNQHHRGDSLSESRLEMEEVTATKEQSSLLQEHNVKQDTVKTMGRRFPHDISLQSMLDRLRASNENRALNLDAASSDIKPEEFNAVNEEETLKLDTESSEAMSNPSEESDAQAAFRSKSHVLSFCGRLPVPLFDLTMENKPTTRQPQADTWAEMRTTPALDALRRLPQERLLLMDDRAKPSDPSRPDARQSSESHHHRRKKQHKKIYK